MCHGMVFLWPSAMVAQEVGTLVLPICIVFGGLYAPYAKIPDHLRSIWHVSFATNGFRALSQNELLETGDPGQMEMYGVHGKDNRSFDILCLWIWIGLLNVLSFLIMVYLDW